MQQRFRNPEATRFANKVVFLLEREFARPIRPQYELRRTTLPLDPSFATEPRGPSLRWYPRNLTRLRGTQCPAVKEPHVPIAQRWGIFFPRCPGERSREPNRDHRKHLPPVQCRDPGARADQGKTHLSHLVPSQLPLVPSQLPKVCGRPLT